MENRSDYEKRLGEKLEAAYMLEDIEPGMSREEFHRLILAAEKRKKRRRSLLGLAAACVALCLVCGGFMAGMTMRESASAGKDGETKIVQQGDSVIIGSGASENNQNVGNKVKKYFDAADLKPEDAERIAFWKNEDNKLESIEVIKGKDTAVYTLVYSYKGSETIKITEKPVIDESSSTVVMSDKEKIWHYRDVKIAEKITDDGRCLTFEYKDTRYVITYAFDSKIKNEVLLKDLID